jgi:VanZ family protein
MHTERIKKLSQVAAWLLLLAIVVLSTVPPEDRPVTPAPHDIEHMGIFLLTGLSFGLGYARRYSLQLFGLVAFSAAIEMIQLVIPGRHARLSDFIVDAASASVGVGLAIAITRCESYLGLRHGSGT